MSWLFFAIVSTILTAINILLSREFIKNEKHMRSYTIIWELCIAAVGLLFIPFFPFSFSIAPNILILVCLSAILYSFSNFFRVQSFRYEDVGTISSLLPISSIFTVLTSIIFFHSAASAHTILGFIIIIIATALISIQKVVKMQDRGMYFAFFYLMLSGIAVAIDASVISWYSIPLYLCVSNFLQATMSRFVFLRPYHTTFTEELKREGKSIAIPAFFLATGNIFLLKAFTLGHTIQIISVRSSLTLLVIILAIYLFHEKDRIPTKLLCAILAVVGIIIINI